MLKRTRRSSKRVQTSKNKQNKSTRKKDYNSKLESLGIIADCINKYDTNFRKRKLPTLQALEAILFMIETGLSYNKMEATKYLEYIDPSTLRKRFRKWVELDIPRLVWNDITSQYMEGQLLANKRCFKTIFIDSTMIKNDLGMDCVGRNPTDRGRKGSKISVAVSGDMALLGCSFAGSNQADVTEVTNVIDAIPSQLKSDGRHSINFVGDKGYVSKDLKTELWNERKIRLVTENKKTKKNPIPEPLSRQDEALLRQRYVVENFFCSLKKSFRRFQIRRERWLRNFEGLFFISATVMNMRIIMGDTSDEMVEIEPK